MKILLALVITVTSITASAQSISIGSPAKVSYCVGDSIIVPYQANGPFANDNAFILQFSDANGSFANFSNSVQNAARSGFLATTLHGLGSHYRVRVISSDPYSVSEDNGSDIAVLPYPSANIQVFNTTNNRIYGAADHGIGLIETKFQFTPMPQTGSTYSWKFDNDANILNSSGDTMFVSYLTPGIKTATLTVKNANDCASARGYTFYVGTCEPQIPSNAKIVTTKMYGINGGGNVWVKPGGTYWVSDGDTVFAEPGSIVATEIISNCIIYLRPGCQFKPPPNQPFVTNSVVILPQNWGANWMGQGTDTFQCANLTFDYSQVSGSVDGQPSAQISINQTPDHLLATIANQPLELRLLNLLGNEVLSRRGTGELDVDLSLLAAGIYIAVAESGGHQRVTKKIAVVN